jgi:Ran-binding protein 1
MAGDDEKEVRVVDEATPSTEADEPSKAGEEEDTGAQIAPIIKLEEVAISTGEENEEVLIDMKAKLYRFDKEGTQWKERGVGQVKILEHKTTKKVRLLMRQSRTLKICANHMVTASTQLQEHAGSDKSWVWHARDYSDGELKEELFCMRFGSVESAQKFKDVYEAAQEKEPRKPEEKDEQAEETAELLDKLKVESKSEDASAAEEKKTEVKEVTESKGQ